MVMALTISLSGRGEQPQWQPDFETYVVFGRPRIADDNGALVNDFGTEVELYGLDGSNGFVINGMRVNGYSGHSVSSAGDVNGDGVGDLIIGAHEAASNGSSKVGASYVVFGKKTHDDNGVAIDAFAAALELSDLNGSLGFVINGIDREDQGGFSVSGAGDINGDGYDDLIIGARRADPNGNNSGETYVVYGQASYEHGTLDLATAPSLVINGSRLCNRGYSERL